LFQVAKKTKFPWLLSNVVDIVSGGLLAEGQATHMITWNGKKIGFVGLIEEDWIATLSTLDPEDVEYIDFVLEGRKLAQELKQQGADYVIALTHMRWPNDTLLAEKVDEIDLILGGHDHDYTARRINGKLVVKSGTDFRGFANVKLVFKPDGSVESSAEEFSVTSSIAEDEVVKSIVENYTKILGDELDTIIGTIKVDLDGRFESIRRRETNLGNFITNIMLSATDADVALLNSGTLRSDRIHPIGDFRLRDLVSILPMVDNLVVVEVTGSQLLEALENGVSKYPALEGRFPQVICSALHLYINVYITAEMFIPCDNMTALSFLNHYQHLTA
jgi:5'-nucleotidase